MRGRGITCLLPLVDENTGLYTEPERYPVIWLKSEYGEKSNIGTSSRSTAEHFDG